MQLRHEGVLAFLHAGIAVWASPEGGDENKFPTNAFIQINTF